MGLPKQNIIIYTHMCINFISFQVLIYKMKKVSEYFN